MFGVLSVPSVWQGASEIMKSKIKADKKKLKKTHFVGVAQALVDDAEQEVGLGAFGGERGPRRLLVRQHLAHR
jgi:hypothetical protein